MESKNQGEYEFEKQLALSQAESSNGNVGEILTSTIPTAVRSRPANLKQDKQGIDWFVELGSGKEVGVDVKVRAKDCQDFGNDDVLLETWSKFKEQKIGWTLDERKQCDYIFYLWADTGRWMLIPFVLLLKVFRKNQARWTQEYGEKQTSTTNNGGWTTKFVCVPRRELWAEVYKEFGGNARLKKQVQKVGKPEDCNLAWYDAENA